MSRIKDYLAEVEDIDDLKPPLYEVLGEKVYIKCKNRPGLHAWLRENYTYECGEDKDGRDEFGVDNGEMLYEELAQEELDALIEEQHLDITDECYKKTIEYAANWLGDLMLVFEGDCAQEFGSEKIDLPFEDEMKGHC